jgi:hypothetical protein
MSKVRGEVFMAVSPCGLALFSENTRSWATTSQRSTTAAHLFREF